MKQISSSKRIGSFYMETVRKVLKYSALANVPPGYSVNRLINIDIEGGKGK